MASGVAAESILFIGAIIAATAVAGVLTGVTQVVSNDVRTQGELRADALRSDITILNDPATVVTSPSLLLYVKNTGSTALNAPDLSIIVDGTLTSATFDVIGSADDETWPPGDVVLVTAATSLGSGDHRVRLTAGPGATAHFVWSD